MGATAPMMPDRSPVRPIRRIGAGAMGDVWLGSDERDGRQVVIKVMHGHLGAGLEDRLRLEAEALARIDSPHVVKVYGWGHTRDRRPYLLLEYLEGEPLDALVKARKWLPAAEAVALVRQLLLALAAVHHHGIVHRDVKPSNAFVCRPGDHLKLLDFGIIKLIEDVTGVTPLRVRTQHGSAIGTPRYMAPEQVRGKHVDGRTDLYAVGMVLYQMLAGAHPFQDVSRGKVERMMMAHLREIPVPPSQRARQPIPAELDALVLRAIEKDPADRFADALAMVRALDAVLLPGTAATPRPSHHEPLRATVRLPPEQAPPLRSEAPRRAIAEVPAAAGDRVARAEAPALPPAPAAALGSAHAGHLLQSPAASAPTRDHAGGHERERPRENEGHGPAAAAGIAAHPAQAAGSAIGTAWVPEQPAPSERASRPASTSPEASGGAPIGVPFWLAFAAAASAVVGAHALGWLG